MQKSWKLAINDTVVKSVKKNSRKNNFDQKSETESK